MRVRIPRAVIVDMVLWCSGSAHFTVDEKVRARHPLASLVSGKPGNAGSIPVDRDSGGLTRSHTSLSSSNGRTPVIAGW